MIYGKTEKETLELNGWGIGDILEGDGRYGTDRILITEIGEEKFLCKYDYGCKGIYAGESGMATLVCRNWRKVNQMSNVFPEKLNKYLKEQVDEGYEVIYTSSEDGYTWIIDMPKNNWIVLVQWYEGNDDFSIINICDNSLRKLINMFGKYQNLYVR